MRKRENKNYRSVSFQSEQKKIAKKLKKIKKIPLWIHLSRNRLVTDEKERTQKLSFRSFPTRPAIENSKKIAKKFKNLKNTIRDSFKAKIGMKLMRKRVTKIIVPIRSYPKRNRKFHKNSQKMQKMKKYHYDFISGQNRLENEEKERK